MTPRRTQDRRAATAFVISACALSVLNRETQLCHSSVSVQPTVQKQPTETSSRRTLFARSELMLVSVVAAYLAAFTVLAHEGNSYTTIIAFITYTRIFRKAARMSEIDPV